MSPEVGKDDGAAPPRRARPDDFHLIKRLAAEFLGSAMLLFTVITSMILGYQHLGDNLAVAVLMNALAVAFVLTALIEILEPVSYCHINPAVTLAMMVRRKIGIAMGLGYVAVQFAGGLAGLAAAHLMFMDQAFFKLATVSQVARGPGQYLGEFLGTFALLLTIFGCMARRTRLASLMIGLVVGGLTLGTSSTMFANPQVTFARIFTFSVAGVRPVDGMLFMFFQILGALAAAGVAAWLFKPGGWTDTEGAES